jgi:hypothetical protein
VLRTDTERPLAAPVSPWDSRPDTERRDACEEDFDEREEWDEEESEDRPDSAPDRAAGTPGAAPDPAGTAAPPVAGAGSGASPQVSQYSPPSPMSSKVPSQPGRWHLLTVSPSAFP